jgi:hypothetical protein
MPPPKYPIQYYSGSLREPRIPFPDHARGFLYLHNPFNQPSIASSIRLRCLPSNNPSEFDQGKDLARPGGLPWELGLPRVLTVGPSCIRDYLLHAEVMTNEQMTRWRHVVKQSGRTIRHLADPHTLHRLDQPFPINFHQHYRIRIATKEFVGSMFRRPVFQDYRNGRRVTVRPYRGTRFQHCLFSNYS